MCAYPDAPRPEAMKSEQATVAPPGDVVSKLIVTTVEQVLRCGC